MENFAAAAPGTCAYCGDREVVVRPAKCSLGRETRDVEGSSSSHTFEHVGQLGVCDVCAYALGHAWKKVRGERVSEVSPYVARTYVLVPRLPEGKSEQDVSAYEFLVGEDGGLPSVEFLKCRDPKALSSWLVRQYGVATWVETVRRCYLGYSGSAEFSEVVLAWAWGRPLLSMGHHVYKFASFGTLLARPTPDAGFYLGVKAAFEGLLWRSEAVPEGNRLSVCLRESAMRYLRYHLAGDDDRSALLLSGEDESMVDLCRGVMTPEELEVAAVLDRSREVAQGRTRALAAKEEVRAEARGAAYEGDATTEDVGGEDLGGEDGGQVDEGFVRERRPLVR